MTSDSPSRREAGSPDKPRIPGISPAARDAALLMRSSTRRVRADHGHLAAGDSR
ncbi:hypothetical protein [Brevibacterium gallinarum]|uniref:Uncharacterized protein n=1 Tax=Brevibacterium gallinarum TaxID=2762220 RepID=A0ABR8WUL7_9MICO|nr:hypothetical protein [Brevibacterium gallinarum]MBD8020346.1 hypothetical protein [Brevibacterium gallinarum]